MTSKPSSSKLPVSASSQHGFTLIEVVVALVLLASVLVGVTLATARQQRLGRLAADRAVASNIADAMLRKWFESASGIPQNSKGEIVNRSGWHWQTRLVRITRELGAPAGIVQLQISQRKNNAFEVVLVELEVVVDAS